MKSATFFKSSKLPICIFKMKKKKRKKEICKCLPNPISPTTTKSPNFSNPKSSRIAWKWHNNNINWLVRGRDAGQEMLNICIISLDLVIGKSWANFKILKFSFLGRMTMMMGWMKAQGMRRTNVLKGLSTTLSSMSAMMLMRWFFNPILIKVSISLKKGSCRFWTINFSV